jgi:acetyltransferase
MSEHKLAALFEPSSVAVIGASATPGKVGHSVLYNLTTAGYQGRIFPVNPRGGEMLGLPVAASIGDIPGPLDMAVICIPPRHVPDAVRELARVPTRSVVVITAGFKESGREGWYLEQEVAGLCREHDMALLGPNCLGIMNTAVGLNASFARDKPQPGQIAFFSQSGALCVAILDWAMGERIGFSKFVSLGNKALIDEAHMLAALKDDPQTKVILGYIEGVEDGQRFLKAASEVSAEKPVILIKSGTTAAGAKAASSHTGAMAGSDQAYGAAFAKAGIIRVGDVAQLFNLAVAFSSQPLPRGPNLAVVTNSGGPGILAADAAGRSSLIMGGLSSTTVNELMSFLPPFAAVYNPVDIIGDADAARYRRTLEVVAKDPMVHSLLVMLTPTAMVQVEETARAIADVAATADKPVFACFMGQKRVAAGRDILVAAGVPCYSFPEPAVASIEAMYAYRVRAERPPQVGVCTLRDKPRAEAVLAKARREGCSEIVEFQAQELLKAYSLPVPETRLARTSSEAAAAAAEIGGPVVLKIASPQISHKSDVGGVVVNLKGEDAVKRAFQDITARAAGLRPDAYIIGCLVQAMAKKGAKECIVGFKRDPQFGPMIIFGLGGIYVEVLKDIAIRLVPLSKEDARDMIREIKSFPLLRGVRGEAAVDFASLEAILLAMSQLAEDFPEILEAEFNPVLAGPEGALVADVRVTVCSEEPAPDRGRLQAG